MGVMKEFLIKNKTSIIIGVIFILIIFFAVRSCSDRQLAELRGKNEEKAKIIEKLKDGVRVYEEDRLRLKDSINLENIKKEKTLKEFKQKELASKERIKYLEKDALKEKAVISNMSLNNVASQLNNIYGGNNAKPLENSIDIRGFLPYQLLNTVVDKNLAENTLKEKDMQLGLKDSVILVKDEQLKNSSLNLFSAEKSLNSYKEISELQTELTKSLEKENRKRRRQNTFNKILIPIAGAAGLYTGYKLGSK